MSDEFFTKKHCQRCQSPLNSRIMSWFTEEVICMECSAKEDEIKEKLRATKRLSMEGCGYIPTVE